MAIWQKWLMGVMATVFAAFLIAASAEAIEVLEFKAVAMEVLKDIRDDIVEIKGDLKELKRDAGH